MLEIVQTPLARRIWKISKFFRLPINDERIQDLNPFDLDFYELSMIADDPKKLEQLKNHYYDPEFEEWLEEFDAEQESKQDNKSGDIAQNEDLNMPDEETIEWAKKNRSNEEEDEVPYEDDYEISVPTDVEDWEDVD